MRRVLFLVTLAVICFAGVAQASPPVTAQRTQQSPSSVGARDGGSAVRRMARSMGLTPSDLTSRLARQPAYGEIAQRAASLFQTVYAGAWVDTSTSNLVVSFTSIPADVVSALGVPGDLLAYVLVRGGAALTHAQLEAAQNAVISLDQSSTHDQGYGIAAYIDDSSDRVDVEVSDKSTSTAELRALDNLATTMPLTIFNSTVDNAFVSCNTSTQYCDHPLRGGPKIYTRYQLGQFQIMDSCTAGFYVVGTGAGNLGHDYILTAGHCLQGDDQTTFQNGTTQWYSHNAAAGGGTEFTIGHQTDYTLDAYGDSGVIFINANNGSSNPDVYVQSSTGGVLDTTYNDYYAIDGSATAVQNDIVCKQGETGGAGCGTVKSGDATANPATGFYIYHQIRIDLGASTGLHICEGDSGGPVFVQHNGYGIVSSGYNRIAGPGPVCYTGYYAEPISRAQNERQVQLADT